MATMASYGSSQFIHEMITHDAKGSLPSAVWDWAGQHSFLSLLRVPDLQ